MIRLAPILLVLALLSGCMGSAPGQRYLTISEQWFADCGENNSASDLVLAVKDLESLPALDRTSVLIGDERVLTPSHVWYWEGTPAESLTIALVNRISCVEGYQAVWPYRPRVERNALLTGRVHKFAAYTVGQPRFEVSAHLEVWDSRGKSKLAGRVFTASSEMPGFDPTGPGSAAMLADAAEEAVRQMLDQAAEWIASGEAAPDKQE
jgi:hypothetical protein